MSEIKPSNRRVTMKENPQTVPTSSSKALLLLISGERIKSTNISVIAVAVAVAILLLVLVVYLPLFLWSSRHNVFFSSPPDSLLRTTTTNWMSIEVENNYTSSLLSKWATYSNATKSRTTNITISQMDDTITERGFVRLVAGKIHEFNVSTFDEKGEPRLLGGDYYEIGLFGNNWRSRVPFKDNGDGNYTFHLQIHPDFLGTYNLTITLLFRSFEGLLPQPFAYHKDMREIPITFHANETVPVPLPPHLELCRSPDFTRKVWSGRWTRHVSNDDHCNVSSNDGRYRCLDPNTTCQIPWCSGSVGALESNGYVYSTHCSFRIFTQEKAWECLIGKWLFFWGDSNNLDTIRNLLNFVLGLWDVHFVGRRYDSILSNPRDTSEVVRITSIFNGHFDMHQNGLGLKSLRNQSYQDLLRGYFNEEKAPDIVVMNSGLHDGASLCNFTELVESADYAIEFWENMYRKLIDNNKRIPTTIYRTTIAAAGYGRDSGFNTQKMEALNNVMVEKYKDSGLLSGSTGGVVVDDFDMTFPWHYDLRCSDGLHYGREPTTRKWVDGIVGHQYFVDLMLVHVLLNAMCNDN